MKNHYHNINLTGKGDRILALVKAVFLPLLLAIAIIALPMKRADAQAPTLSYNSPQVYLPNAVITPLAQQFGCSSAGLQHNTDYY